MLGRLELAEEGVGVGARADEGKETGPGAQGESTLLLELFACVDFSG